MVRRLLAHVQCQLALRQWEEKLEVALRLFWLGDFAAADEVYGQLLHRIIPYLAILEAPRLPPATTRYALTTERLFGLATQIAVGRWAISYIQGGQAPLPHPPLSAKTPGGERAYCFVIDVHLARADLSEQALRTYVDFIDRYDDPQRLAQLNDLMQSAQPSASAERVLRAIYEGSAEHVESGRRLCTWLIHAGRITEARALAERLFRRHPTDTACADLLAYTAEATHEWRIACAAYSRAGNPLRSAFMAMLANDEPLLDAAVQELPDSDLHTPLGYLCEGRLAYQRGKLRQALDAWILAVSPGTEQEQDIPLLAALRSFEEDPSTALLEIRTLAGDRLPAAALVALGWLAEQFKQRPRRRRQTAKNDEPTASAALRQILLTQQPGATEDPGYPFVKAVAASAAISFLADADAAERPILLRWLEPPLRSRIEAIAYAKDRRWFEALAVLGDGKVTPLHRRLTRNALAESLQKRDWPATHQLLDDWRDVLHTLVSLPNLEQCMHQDLWNSRNYPLLAQELARILLSDDTSLDTPSGLADAALRTHHNAAIVNAQMAQPTRTVEGWRPAIAHWAVVLANGAYWRNWYEKRRARYGAGADTLDPAQLPERIAQQVAESWQRGLSQEARLRCLALLSWEWQSVLAMRHLFRLAEEDGIALPAAVLHLISPTLIHHHAAEDVPSLLAALAALDVSADARALLQAAFSPEAEVEALISAGHFDLALNLGRARNLPPERLRPLQVQAEQQVVEELLQRGDVDGALHVAVNVYQEFNDAPLAEPIFTNAVHRWSMFCIEQGLHEKVLQRLLELQERFPEMERNFHPLLAASYAAEGQRRLDLGDIENARLDFLSALQYDGESETVRAQLSLIYHNRAVDAIEEGDLDSAVENATQAMRYLADPETSTLLVDIHTRLAQAEAQRSEWISAQKHVGAVLNHGRACDDTNLFTQCVNILLDLFIQYRRQDQAVALLEGAARLPHNRAILDIENALASLLVRELGGRRV